MEKKSLIASNRHLKNAKVYRQALRVNVLSSMAIEGVRKAAARALPVSVGKTAKA
jgi:hypothetical protein